MAFATLSKLLLLSGCIRHALASPKVVPLAIKGSKRSPLSQRDAAAVTLDNRVDVKIYSANVTVGTPPQSLWLQVDTGSSDIWFFNPQACQEVQCIDGAYDPTKSSTYQLVEEGTFNISYADKSNATGDFITETIDLGNGLKVSNQTMGLATQAYDNTYGLIGIAFNTNEAAGDDKYPTIVDSLFSAGLIKSHSYSLWLDDLESSTGTLLFGGYDSGQYSGELTVLPLLDDYDLVANGESGVVSFTVDMSMVALTDGSGSTTILNENEFPIPVILDSGTSLTELPPDSFYQLAEYFGAYFDQTAGTFLVPCDVASWKGTIDYGFGGPGGAIIQVPFSEIILPADGASACQFGLEIATDAVLIGDTFLRSAYVVYDLDSLQVGIAQSNWNSTTSNIKEIGPGDLASIISGSRNDTNATLPLKYYTSLAYLEAQTEAPELSGTPMTATVSGVKTSLSVVAAPTEPAATGSSTSTAGGAIQTAAYLLPMALPFAAALL